MWYVKCICIQNILSLSILYYRANVYHSNTSFLNISAYNISFHFFFILVLLFLIVLIFFLTMSVCTLPPLMLWSCKCPRRGTNKGLSYLILCFTKEFSLKVTSEHMKYLLSSSSGSSHNNYKNISHRGEIGGKVRWRESKKQRKTEQKVEY